MQEPGLYLVTDDNARIPIHTAGGDRNLVELNDYLYGWEISPMQQIQSDTHEWRMDKWPDLTPLAQLAGTDVEVSELLEMEVKGEHYDEDWMDDEQFKKEIGDVLIYLMGYASLRDLDVAECIDAAMDKNENRDWDDHMKAP